MSLLLAQGGAPVALGETPLLYAIAYERFDVARRAWTAGIEYVTSPHAPGARVAFFQLHPNVRPSHLRIVGIAPAVGVHVDDEHGDVLSA